MHLRRRYNFTLKKINVMLMQINGRVSGVCEWNNTKENFKNSLKAKNQEVK